MFRGNVSCRISAPHYVNDAQASESSLPWRLSGTPDTRSSGSGDGGHRVTCLWIEDLTDCPQFTDGETEVESGHRNDPKVRAKKWGRENQTSIICSRVWA